MFSLVKKLSLGGLLMALLILQVHAAEVVVTLDSELSTFEVSYAPGSGLLRAHDEAIWDDLEIIDNALKRGRELTPLAASDSVTYRVGLSHSGAQWAISRWHAPLRLADWHSWLLTPVDWSMTRPIDIRIQLPEAKPDALNVTLPFERVQQDASGIRYRAFPVLADHGGMTMFGNIQTRLLRIGDSRIELAVTGGKGEESAKLFNWAEDVINTVVDVHGTGPGRATIMMVPVPLVSGVVPWAHVRRGGGSHIIAYVKEDLSPDELYQDWTLFHEMTHLYHPYLHSGGRWVSEGLASYYQNVYRARAGVVSPDYALSRLAAGLERGRKENETAGNRLVTQGGRMRTYWTGAALAYQADAYLYETTGKSELARAIGYFAAQRMPVNRSWHPRDYLAQLDAHLSHPILVDLYDEYRRDRYFPTPQATPEINDLIFRSGQSGSRKTP